MIQKHEIPILEYDSAPKAILEPTHERLPVQLPQKAVFAFLGEEIDRFAREQRAEKIAEFITISSTISVYRMAYKGEEICLCQTPMGAAAAAEMLDWLIGYGVRKVICAGSCGVLIDLPENVFLIPVRALRDEGTSYHYLPPSRYVELNPDVRRVMEEVLRQQGLSYQECVTWSTDGIFRETAEMTAYRREEGCAVVEMECAALTACAQFRGIAFGQLLFTADTLADAAAYDERDWGMDSLKPALLLCLEIAAAL